MASSSAAVELCGVAVACMANSPPPMVAVSGQLSGQATRSPTVSAMSETDEPACYSDHAMRLVPEREGIERIQRCPLCLADIAAGDGVAAVPARREVDDGVVV